MIGALLYLELRSRANALRLRLRRLREPRYLFGAIVGLAYLWFFFGRHFFAAPGARGNPFSNPVFGGMGTLWGGDVGALVLFAYVSLGWFFGGGQAKLPFTEAEVAWLFPAPIPRRTLVQFKLLQAQIPIVLTSLVFATLAAAGGGAGALLTRFGGWWTVFTFINLHGLAANFTRERLAARGLGPVRRRLVLGFAFGALAVAAWLTARDHLAAAPAAEISFDSLAEGLRAALAAPPLRWVLAPFGLVVAPFHAATPAAFLAAFGPALALLALHYLWALRTIVGFEEASAAAAEKRAAVLQAARSGRGLRLAGALKARSEPFRLGAVGRPEIAWLWQRLIAAGPWLFPRRIAVVVAATLAVAWWMRGQPHLRSILVGVTIGSGAIAAYVLLLAPAVVRRTWTQLFDSIDLAKSYPVRGWQVVLGELLTPVVLLTAIELTLLALVAVCGPAAGAKVAIRADLVWSGWAAAVALLPPLAGILFGAQLALGLVFPAWFRPSPGTVGGFEMIGQRIILTFGFLVVFLAALVPASAVAAVPFFVVRLLDGPAALAVFLAGLGAAAMLATEFAMLLWWLGRRFEHLDLAQDLPR